MHKLQSIIPSSVLFLSAVFLVAPLAHAAEPTKPVVTSVPTTVKSNTAARPVTGTKAIVVKPKPAAKPIVNKVKPKPAAKPIVNKVKAVKAVKAVTPVKANAGTKAAR